MKTSHSRRAASVFAGLCAALLLNACGGGSAESGTQSGTFIDSPVGGLSYVSGNITGTTDAAGTYRYQAGEPITFRVGGVVIGTVNPKAIITPVDLVAGATDEMNSSVTNIAKFLQTIDDDGDPDNGITITAAAAAAANGMTLDFSQSTADFAANADVLAAITAITSATTAGERVLISSADAQNHLRSNLLKTLAGSYSGTFSGTDVNGSFSITISNAGNITGSGVDNEGTSFEIAGSVNSAGSGAFGVAGASNFTGKIDPATGAISGTWDGAGGGTFSGTKQ